MPHFPCQLEIPDDWLAEANVLGFVPSRSAFRSLASATEVSLTQIEPPPRLVGYPLTWRGLDRTRFISVLDGVRKDAEIEAVPIVGMPHVELGSSPYRFRVRDGVHRFYASVAMGFTHLPVEREL